MVLMIVIYMYDSHTLLMSLATYECELFFEVAIILLYCYVVFLPAYDGLDLRFVRFFRVATSSG